MLTAFRVAPFIQAEILFRDKRTSATVKYNLKSKIYLVSWIIQIIAVFIIHNL
jgi:hypothetical protein